MVSLRNIRILVPTDFSPCSEHALAHAKALAKPLQAELHLIHVLEPIAYLPQWGYLDANITDALCQAQEAATKELEQRALALQKEGLATQTATLGGRAHSEIIAYANEHNIQMIVMGMQGRRGIEHMLLGSTTERVIRMARCPVLSVHSTKREQVAHT